MESSAPARDPFFDKMRQDFVALTFDDVRLRTGLSDVGAADVSLKTRFSRRVTLGIPVVSAAMDTVTRSRMAIALATLGGLGVIHCAMSIEDQAEQVARVKHHLHARIDKPIVVRPDETVGAVLRRCADKGYPFRTFPVVDADDKLVGVMTQNDFDLSGPDQLVKNAMTSELVTAAGATTIDQAHALMLQRKKKVLPLVDERGMLAGMYVLTDVSRVLSGEQARYNVDAQGMLRVGAAVSPTEGFARVEALVRKRADVVVIDSARGDSERAAALIRRIKETYGDRVDVVAGNVSEGESAKRLADAGADGIKVGQGGGSICTTRIVAGVGCPQVTAVAECERALRGMDVPICSDGGIRHPGDIPIAIGAGASSVMMGGALAGTDEAPGDVVEYKGARYKNYRGMGSRAALLANESSRRRYAVDAQWTPEGVESLVPHRGSLESVVGELMGGLRQSMGYQGTTTISELQARARFWRLTGAGLAESKPHDVVVVEGIHKS